MPMLLVAVVVGGALGAIARFAVARWVDARARSAFPWGTLTVNMSGSLALGVLLPLFDPAAPAGAGRALLTVGVLGAFTTFSSFAMEALTLAERGRTPLAAAYVATSVLLGLACIAAGLAIGRILVG